MYKEFHVHNLNVIFTTHLSGQQVSQVADGSGWGGKGGVCSLGRLVRVHAEGRIEAGKSGFLVQSLLAQSPLYVHQKSGRRSVKGTLKLLLCLPHTASHISHFRDGPALTMQPPQNTSCGEPEQRRPILYCIRQCPACGLPRSTYCIYMHRILQLHRSKHLSLQWIVFLRIPPPSAFKQIALQNRSFPWCASISNLSHGVRFLHLPPSSTVKIRQELVKAFCWEFLVPDKILPKQNVLLNHFKWLCHLLCLNHS